MSDAPHCDAATRRLSKARKRKKLTLAQAATKLKLTQAALRGIEQGEFRPTDAEMAAIRQLYDLAPDDIPGQLLLEA